MGAAVNAGLQAGGNAADEPGSARARLALMHHEPAGSGQRAHPGERPHAPLGLKDKLHQEHQREASDLPKALRDLDDSHFEEIRRGP